MEMLKKMPSKSILVSPSEAAERRSQKWPRQEQLEENVNRPSDFIKDNSINIERLSRGSMASKCPTINDRASFALRSNFEKHHIDPNRRSAVSIKSVTFNGMTQVRHIRR